MKAIKLTLFALIVSLAACSVRKSQVVNQPPVIESGLVKFENEYGTLKSTSISFFYAPAGQSEEGAQEYFRKINSASANIDIKTYQNAGMKKKIADLGTEFQNLKCVEDFAAETDINPNEGDDADLVTKWKTIAETDANYARLGQCKTNQDARMQLSKNIRLNIEADGADDPKNTGISKSTQEILKTVGEENMKSIAPGGTSFVLTAAAAAKITLAGFIESQNMQSTEVEGPGKIRNASYDVVRKLLRFEVPELDAQGNPTGAVFSFALERGPDFLGLARFSGDANLLRGETVLKHGIAKFEGLLQN